MGLKEKVYELMKNPKGITVKEIAKTLIIEEKDVNSYIKRLKKDNKITDNNIIDKIYFDNKRGKKYYLYRVLEKPMDKNSLKSPLNIQILKNGILELNKLMSITKPKIPSNIDKNKIIEAIELCHTI
ncbi:hypothetical protein LCGC14_1663620 [marine sediment metagenome]|uniref:Uncharacterized protein n=1 Tax=marine sediment metagenome TaxID=412755 RepID=A0A0F9KTE7_9ZZZZ|nr:MAG: hypothetical protein Lokiarch_46800 [Candidatus Lokiarchaeum sp. GC14_75]